MRLCRVGLVLCLGLGVVYWWCLSGDLMASWRGASDVLVTLQCLSLYCAGASWWLLGIRWHAVFARYFSVLGWHLSGTLSLSGV